MAEASRLEISFNNFCAASNSDHRPSLLIPFILIARWGKINSPINTQKHGGTLLPSKSVDLANKHAKNKITSNFQLYNFIPRGLT